MVADNGFSVNDFQGFHKWIQDNTTEETIFRGVTNEE